jgi:putative redox protein
MTVARTGAAPATSDVDGGHWVASRVGASGYRADITARTHAFTADEPVTLGGADAGPTPYEYLLAALGGCMAMTLRMYADRKGWPLESVEVRLRNARSHEPDCEHCDSAAVGITTIERTVDLMGPLTDDQRKRLLLLADRCPVKQTLERGFKIQSTP